jgi:DNA-binding transcriptional LysR family regulator
VFTSDDIAVFIALYRERTTGRAAASLGVSQPTVVRRIAALEQDLKLMLFKRTSSGLLPTDAANCLFDAALRIERSVCEFTAEAGAIANADLEVIRLTFLDHFERLLLPVLRDFHSRWPDVQTELLASERLYDLSRGEADIGLRGRQHPTNDEIVVRELPPTGWTVYAPANGEQGERPHEPTDVTKFPIAVIDGPPGDLPIYQWLRAIASERQTPIRCSNFRALRSAVLAGVAISAFPCTVADDDAELVSCFPPRPEFDVPVFLLARRAILRRAPARDLFEAIASYFNNNAVLVTGQRV